MSEVQPIFSTLVLEMGDDIDDEIISYIDSFVETSLPEMIAEIEQCAQDENWDELKKRAHTLKGTAGGYGYMDITELMKSVEQTVLDEQYGEIGQMVDELKQLRDGILLGHGKSKLQ